MERNNVVMLVLVIVVALLAISSISQFATGYGIKDLLRGSGGKSICTSNGYECGDCVDNDGDGLIDYKVNRKGNVIGDLDCTSLTDNTEAPCSPVCNTNSNCGTNGYVGNPYCGGDENVYRDYKTYICSNPGECTAACNSQIDSFIWQTCSFGCSNGVCNSPPSDSCSDSDGGQISFVLGTVGGNLNGTSYSNSDYCAGNFTVKEYYCSGNYKQSTDIGCTGGNFTMCVAGRCI